MADQVLDYIVFGGNRQNFGNQSGLVVLVEKGDEEG
jgi:hypothetical protein